jgi:hypothetical protein
MSCGTNEVDAAQETRIVVQALKIERLEEKQEELRERLKVVEKVGYWSSSSLGSWGYLGGLCY